MLGQLRKLPTPLTHRASRANSSPFVPGLTLTDRHGAFQVGLVTPSGVEAGGLGVG
jgi:hypothetical protein